MEKKQDKNTKDDNETKIIVIEKHEEKEDDDETKEIIIPKRIKKNLKNK